ncbi:MAG: glucuronyl hydrolase, partial [Lentisphaerae bacterium]|nr:glucuronyl hydrolase [Lentisphaerota bacterium]
MMYRETRKPEYLTRAIKLADFLVNHPNLPADKVPYWDYQAAEIPHAPRDSSAAAIMASALLELSTIAEAPKAARYRETAIQQLISLSSPAYRAPVGENGNFILLHGVGHLPGNSEIDVPLNYGDYYFLEGLLRFRRLFQ